MPQPENPPTMTMDDKTRLGLGIVVMVLLILLWFAVVPIVAKITFPHGVCPTLAYNSARPLVLSAPSPHTGVLVAAKTASGCRP